MVHLLVPVDEVGLDEFDKLEADLQGDVRLSVDPNLDLLINIFIFIFDQDNGKLI